MAALITPGKYTAEYRIETFLAETESNFVTMGAADLDGNGYTDFLFAGGIFPPATIRPTFGDILWQDSEGFRFERGAFVESVHPRAFVIDYFNADEVLDFFIAAHGYDAPPFPGEHDILMISTDGGYQNFQPELTSQNGFTHSAASGDVDNDGDQDILSVTTNSGASFLINNGFGVFFVTTAGLPSSIIGTNPEFRATASALYDMDGDGNLDIVLGTDIAFGVQNGDNQSRIYFGNAEGNFLDSSYVALPNFSPISGNQIVLDVKSIDIDLDGDNDLILSSTQNSPFYVGSGIQVLKNNGNREFVDVTNEALGSNGFNGSDPWGKALHVIDFNGDGIEDIFIQRIGSNNQNSVVVYLGDGDGGFVPLYKETMVPDGNLNFLLGGALPSLRLGVIELSAGQYYSDIFLVNRISIDDLAVLDLSPKDGNDVFRETFGNSTIDGGAGFDIISYDLDRSEAEIILQDDRIIVNRPSSQSDVLFSIEKIQFNEGYGFVFGGEGADTMVFAGSHDSYTLHVSQSGTTITDRLSSQQGTDTLYSIELLSFNDRTIDMNDFSNLTQLSNDQFKSLAEMYVAYFNRAPDAEGLFYWADKLAEGLTMDQIAELFFDQDETRAIYTDPSNTDAFVTAVYANVLGRTPDVDGFSFWKGKLAEGEVTQGSLVLRIIDGANNGNGPSDAAYLSDKTDLGIYYSAIKGLSDSTDGRQVMAAFGDQATANKLGAKTAIDSHYADATSDTNGEFLFNVVGVVDNPFIDFV